MMDDVAGKSHVGRDDCPESAYFCENEHVAEHVQLAQRN